MRLDRRRQFPIWKHSILYYVSRLCRSSRLHACLMPPLSQRQHSPHAQSFNVQRYHPTDWYTPNDSLSSQRLLCKTHNRLATPRHPSTPQGSPGGTASTVHSWTSITTTEIGRTRQRSPPLPRQTSSQCVYYPSKCDTFFGVQVC